MHPKNESIITGYVLNCDLNLVHSDTSDDLITKVFNLLCKTKVSGALKRTNSLKGFRLEVFAAFKMDYDTYTVVGDTIDAMSDHLRSASRVRLDILHDDKPVNKFVFYLGKKEQCNAAKKEAAVKAIKENIETLVELKALKEVCSIIHDLDQMQIDN